MDANEINSWLEDRSVATRRFVRFGQYTLLGVVSVWMLQSFVWATAGWGSANFLPGWSLVVIYLFSAVVGLSIFYTLIAVTAARGGIKWGFAGFGAALLSIFVAVAIGHSLPQLSTLVVSNPVEVTLRIHQSGSNTSTVRKGRWCRGLVFFGPVYELPGGMCTFRRWQTGTSHVFRGHGNALAVRLTGF